MVNRIGLNLTDVIVDGYLDLKKTIYSLWLFKGYLFFPNIHLFWRTFNSDFILNLVYILNWIKIANELRLQRNLVYCLITQST